MALETRENPKNLYLRRIAKEQAISEKEIQARMQWNLPLLSENKKCRVSLDLPILNCQPTQACAEICYASQGRQYYRGAVIKSLAVARLISQDPERAARKIVDEAAGIPIRLAGSGELLPQHSELVRYIREYAGSCWGFTRRIDTHKAIPELMFSIDSTTPGAVLDYVRGEVPVHRRAYLRRPGDPPSSLEVAVTFPTHGPCTDHVYSIPEDSTDCPSIRHRVSGCWECQRCY